MEQVNCDNWNEAYVRERGDSLTRVKIEEELDPIKIEVEEISSLSQVKLETDNEQPVTHSVKVKVEDDHADSFDLGGTEGGRCSDDQIQQCLGHLVKDEQLAEPSTWDFVKHEQLAEPANGDCQDSVCQVKTEPLENVGVREPWNLTKWVISEEVKEERAFRHPKEPGAEGMIENSTDENGALIQSETLQRKTGRWFIQMVKRSPTDDNHGESTELINERSLSEERPVPSACMENGKILSESCSTTLCQGSRTNSYKCTYCERSFTQHCQLKIHIRVHMKEKMFVCGTCGKQFTNKSSLITHKGSHVDQKCNEGTKRANILIQSSEISKNQRPAPLNKRHECPECGKHFRFSSQLKMHQRSHLGVRPYECTECGKGFTQSSHLYIHLRIHSGEKPYECPECKKCFRDSSALINHQKIHSGEKSYACAECGKQFNRASQLIQHRRMHTGEKPYHCSECNKSFRHCSALRSHERIHTGEKSYECPECKKTFRHSSALHGHRRIHTGEKPYECIQCKKMFRHSSDLNRHQKIHSGKKPYKCDECGKSFNLKAHLKQHQRSHTRDKPYRCTTCDKSFNQHSRLQNHQWVHTGKKPFECTGCKKHFSHASTLLRHERMHSGEQPEWYPEFT